MGKRRRYTLAVLGDGDIEASFWTRVVIMLAAEMLLDRAGIKHAHSVTSCSGLFSFTISIRISSTSLLTRAIFSSNVSSLAVLSILDV
jgi:hypothetical protein